MINLGNIYTNGVGYKKFMKQGKKAGYVVIGDDPFRTTLQNKKNGNKMILLTDGTVYGAI